MAQTSLNCENTCDLTYVTASIYDRKTAARHFETFHDILRSLSLVKSYLKGLNVPIWRKRAPKYMRLSGTDGLNKLAFTFLVSDREEFDEF